MTAVRPRVGVALAVAASLGAATAAADPPRWDPGRETTANPDGRAELSRHVGGDGVYHRFDGALFLTPSAGVELRSGGARLASRLELHWLWCAGLYVDYRDALGSGGVPPRSVSFGADVRPIFLPRYAYAVEYGPPWLDLVVDSLSFSFGAFFEGGDAPGAERRGLEIASSIGVPLRRASAAGPWLVARGEVRWADQFQMPSGAGMLLLSWQIPLPVPIDPKPRAFR